MWREWLSRLLGGIFIVAGIGVVIGVVWAIVTTGKWSYLGAALLAITLLGAGWSRLFPDVYEPVPIDHDDPLMKSAIEQARRELHRFKGGLGDNSKQPFVKFPLTMPSGQVEHIWGLVHSLKGSELTVSLANDPVEQTDAADPRRTVRLGDIEDWMLVAGNGETQGGYTMAAMARIFRRDKGFVPSAMKKDLRHFKDWNIADL